MERMGKAIGKRGVTGILVALLLLAGVVALYFAYQKFAERYYILLYDKTIVRRLDIPPFTTRLNPETDSLKGLCTLKVGTTAEQVNTFLSGVCARQGFSFRELEKGFEIEVRVGYSIRGAYEESVLKLTWRPFLDQEAQKRYKEFFQQDWVEPLPEKPVKIPVGPR